MSIGTVSPPPKADEVPIDPRFRERRIAVLRDAGRRRLRRATVVAVVIATLALAFAAAHSPLLDVDSVVVEGATRSGSEAVRVASGIDESDPLLLLDASDAAARIEALPWVKEASVDRKLPSTVRIRVTERTPVAVLMRGSTLVLVDATGRGLGKVASRPLDLVGVEGLRSLPSLGDTTSARGIDAVRVAMRLARELPGEVRAVVAGTPLQLALTDGAVVVLGTDADLDAKLIAVEAMLDQVDRWCLERLDVRAPGTPVLTRRQGCG